mgnify:CR=1 FL=1
MQKHLESIREDLKSHEAQFRKLRADMKESAAASSSLESGHLQLKLMQIIDSLAAEEKRLEDELEDALQPGEGDTSDGSLV